MSETTTEVNAVGDPYCEDCSTFHPEFRPNSDGTYGQLHSTEDDVRRFQLMTQTALERVQDEMIRQINKWGVQSHPSFLLQPNGQVITDRPVDFLHGLQSEEDAKANVEYRATQGNVTWCDILKEELSEALAAAYKAGDGDGTDDETFNELIQVAAVALVWAANLVERRQGEEVMERYEQQRANQNALMELMQLIGAGDMTEGQDWDDDDPDDDPEV